ncbi:hypothetical protein Gotur_020549 [Gossypium turneri]
MSDTATDLESPFERDMCLKGSHDLEDDIDRGLSSDLLRMVEQEEEQILPLEETIEIVMFSREQTGETLALSP